MMIQELKRSQMAALPPTEDVAPAAPAAPAIEEIEGAFITIKRANIREKPLADAKLIKSLEPGVALTVTGRVKDTGWYRVATADDKLRGFVFGDAIQEMKAAEEAEWQRVKDAKESGLVVGFLRRYPDGAHAGEAKALRDALAKTEKQAPVAASTPPQQEATITPPSKSAVAPDDNFRNGRQALRYLEGRWADASCADRFAEYKFTGPDRQEAIFNYVDVGNSGRNLRDLAVKVTFDEHDNIVLYFPSIDWRTTVLFKTNDIRETIDIDNKGKVTSNVYHRCLPQ